MQLLHLSDAKPLAQGHQRNVYQMPGDASALVKTILPGRLDEDLSLKDRMLLKGKRRVGPYASFKREIGEFIAQLRRRPGGVDERYPFAMPRGFVTTTEGLGLVVEKIRGQDGNLAPTLLMLFQAGQITPVHLAATNEFFDVCKRDHIVLGDVHTKNLVFTTARHGMPEVVCVDGLGDKMLIPIYTLSRFMNGRRVERLRRRVIGEITALPDARSR